MLNNNEKRTLWSSNFPVSGGKKGDFYSCKFYKVCVQVNYHITFEHCSPKYKSIKNKISTFSI
jgi:hypothetical protein